MTAEGLWFVGERVMKTIFDDRVFDFAFIFKHLDAFQNMRIRNERAIVKFFE